MWHATAAMVVEIRSPDVDEVLMIDPAQSRYQRAAVVPNWFPNRYREPRPASFPAMLDVDHPLRDDITIVTLRRIALG